MSNTTIGTNSVAASKPYQWKLPQNCRNVRVSKYAAQLYKLRLSKKYFRVGPTKLIL